MSYTPNRVRFADSPAIDAFNRLRVSQAFTAFDAQQEYGLDTLTTWDATANGTIAIGNANGSVTNGSNAVGPTNTDTRMTPITVSTTDAHYSVLQSRQYVRYIPGKSHLVFITGVFAPASGFSASLVLRTSTSGSVSDANAVAQANWNIDTFGAGTKNPSGTTIDFTKTQILFISAQWLGVGRVIMGFDINGQLYPAHQFLNANNLTVPYTQTFNLPVRLEVRNTSATTTVARAGYFDHAGGALLQLSKTGVSAPGGSINFVCCSVQSEGGTDIRGFPRTAGNGITTIGVTTRRPILSIRPRAYFNNRVNRGHIELAQFGITASTNNAFYEIVIGGTLTGASWLNQGTPISISVASSLVVGQSYFIQTFGTTTAANYVSIGATSVNDGSLVVGRDYFIGTVGTSTFTNVGASANTVGTRFTATGTSAGGNGTVLQTQFTSTATSGTGTGTVVFATSIVDYDISATAITGGVPIVSDFVLTGAGVVRGLSTGEADIRNPLTISKIDGLAATQPTISIVCTSFSGTSNVAATFNWHEQTI